MNTLIILQQMAVIAVLVMIGYILFRREAIDQNFTRQLSMIVTYFTNPALMLATILTGDITASKREVLLALIIAAVIYAILCILGIAGPKLLRIPQDEHRYYHMMTVYTNTGFMGIPLAQAVLPENAMIYVVIFNIMFSIYMYTHGIIVLAGRENIRLRKLINPGTVMAVVSLLVYWFDISLPAVPANLAIYLGNATTFLTMLLLGASIARQPVRQSLKNRYIWRYVIYRMIGVPIVFTLILKSIGVNRDMTLAYCLMLALPAANMPLILAEKEGFPTEVLARGIMITTLVSFFTITFVLGILF